MQTPSVRAGTEGKPEDYGEEAKFFVEIRLLQRGNFYIYAYASVILKTITRCKSVP